MTIKVAIADDHLMFVQALKTLFEGATNLQVVFNTDNGSALLAGVDMQDVDVALVDISMPGPGIHAILGRLVERHPHVGVIALTMHLDPALAAQLMTAGLSGYVNKEAAFEELLIAVNEVAAGNTYVSEDIDLSKQSGAEDSLTPRELDCLQLASEGLSNKEIGQRLMISERTVKYHFENTFRKLGARRRGHAVAEARRRQLLSST